MSPPDEILDGARQVFSSAPFVRHVGLVLEGCGQGWCESSLLLAPYHLQQNGVVHAGVQATMADHTAGGAAAMLAPTGHAVLTVEYKVQLLRAARGERLTCRAEVVKPGRTIAAVEASVFAHGGDRSELTARLTATMMYVAAPADR